jgi:hypothetical protein
MGHEPAAFMEQPAPGHGGRARDPGLISGRGAPFPANQVIRRVTATMAGLVAVREGGDVRRRHAGTMSSRAVGHPRAG